MIILGKLDDLVVEETKLNENLLYNVLSEYVRIGKEEQSIIPQEKMGDLNAGQKIVVTLLTLKAMKHLNMRDNEKVGPTEISKLCSVKKGTVLPKVRELSKDSLVNSDDGNYYVPNYNLQRAKKFISKGD